jgi:hypothetical protein
MAPAGAAAAGTTIGRQRDRGCAALDLLRRAVEVPENGREGALAAVPPQRAAEPAPDTGAA